MVLDHLTARMQNGSIDMIIIRECIDIEVGGPEGNWTPTSAMRMPRNTVLLRARSEEAMNKSHLFIADERGQGAVYTAPGPKSISEGTRSIYCACPKIGDQRGHV